MIKYYIVFLIFLTTLNHYKCVSFFRINDDDNTYKPTWDSLDKRPLPKWYDEAKIGIFLHWGVFAVPSFGSEWFWSNWKKNSSEYIKFMNKNYPPDFTYPEFAKDFTAEFFNATQWADLFLKSGAKYVVLTSKHHEGFTLWPSKYSFNWNAMDVGPHRDIIGELSEAVRDKGLQFGLYHSLYEWFNPLYLTDKSNKFTTNTFVVDKILPEMHELINDYKPSILWSDGDWEAEDTYWNSTDFIAWLYNSSPVKDKIVVNDRWGIGIGCKHGDFYNCKDRYNPGVLQAHKWENAMTLDRHSWGFRRNAQLDDYFTINELLEELAMTISCGGNILINVGPSKDGIINPIFQDRLIALGKWLDVNGEAIYSTKPWKYQNDTITTGVWFTSKETDVYGIVLNWPGNNVLQLEVVLDLFNDESTIVQLLGYDYPLKWNINDNIVNIEFPDKSLITSEWTWVIKISGN